MDDISFRIVEQQRKKLLSRDRQYYYINLDKNLPLSRLQTFSAGRLMIIGNAQKDADCCTLFKGGIQYGPYGFAMKGKYKVRIFGENLDKLRFQCSTHNAKRQIPLKNLICSKTLAEYDADFTAPAHRFQFVSHNPQTEPCKIYYITLTRQ